MNLMIQAFAALAEKKLTHARKRAERAVERVIACAAPLETLARETQAVALAKIDELLRESGFGTDASAEKRAARASQEMTALRERLEHLETELALARKRAEEAEARAANARPAKTSRRKSAVTADAPRLDA